MFKILVKLKLKKYLFCIDLLKKTLNEYVLKKFKILYKSFKLLNYKLITINTINVKGHIQIGV